MLYQFHYRLLILLIYNEHLFSVSILRMQKRWMLVIVVIALIPMFTLVYVTLNKTGMYIMRFM